LDLGFSLRILALVYHVAKRARVVAIESLADGDTKGLLLRVFHKHCCPGNRLKDNPVQPNRQRKRNDQQ
jgi:hypothetical protein